MKVFRCSICGYMHHGEQAPDECPQCKAKKDKFVEVVEGSKGALAWADEHRVGIAKDVDGWIVEQLQANFNGECCEVGMYLAMSRQADREGYPEVAEAYKRIAYEEADHASRFGEMLGEVLTGSTKTNLKMRAEAESGACEGKLAVAKKAKELGYDAIHDTVHEMCKDEARHGRVFEALLNRYFK